MLDENSPAQAAVPEAPTGDQGSGEQGAVAESAAPEQPTQTPKALTDAPATPDYKSLTEQLLASPEGRKSLLSHSELAREIDHRASSEAGRRFKAEQEKLEQQQQEWQRRQADEHQKRVDEEMTRLIEEDPTHPLAQRVRGELDLRAQAKTAKEQQEQSQAYMAKYQEETRAQYGSFWLGEIDSFERMLVEDGLLTADEIAKLDRKDNQKYPRPMLYLRDLSKAAAERHAERHLKTMLPKEREALRAELRGEGLANEQTVPTTPGGKGVSENEFMADFASGKTNDFAQAKRMLGL